MGLIKELNDVGIEVVKVEDLGGIYFVIVFVGLLFFVWDVFVCGMIVGIIGYIMREYVCCVILEVVCY